MIAKTFTAGVLALSLSLTSLTPTQAAAGNDDDALAALLALLVFGAAVHELRDRNEERARAPRPDANAWRVLPIRCERAFNTQRRGTVRMFPQRCLNQNYHDVDRLPEACQIRVRLADGGRRMGYGARCLRNAGFRTSRH